MYVETMAKYQPCYLVPAPWIEKRYVDKVAGVLRKPDAIRFLMDNGYTLFDHYLSEYDEMLLHVTKKSIYGGHLWVTTFCYPAGHNRPSYHKEMYEALSKRPHKIEKYPQSYPLDRGEFWYERCKKVAEEHHSSTHSVMNQTAVKLQALTWLLESISLHDDGLQRAGTWKTTRFSVDGSTVLKSARNVGGIFHTIAEHDPAYKNKRKWMHTPDTWLHPASFAYGIPVVEQEAVTPHEYCEFTPEEKKEAAWGKRIDARQYGKTESGRIVTYDYSLEAMTQKEADIAFIATQFSFWAEGVNVPTAPVWEPIA